MLPVIALVGRPNVGKSTLFNALTGRRDALVADQPGLTRDRQYGFGEHDGRRFIVIDTGGLDDADDVVTRGMMAQTQRAVTEADHIILLLDGRSGLTGMDEQIADMLRRNDTPVQLAINKTEGMVADMATAEFHQLGLGVPHAVAAAYGRGIEGLLAPLLAEADPVPDTAPEDEDVPAIAIIGRPNVGKSTLMNRLLGDERVVASPEPGTTRDAIAIEHVRDGTRYTLIDTAGVRRRSKVRERVEKFSIVKTLDAIDRAVAVIALIDAQEGVTDQDVSLMGLALERGRAIVVAINKWDGLDDDARQNVRRLADVKLPFLHFARMHFISARHGSGLGPLFKSVNEACNAARTQLKTRELTEVLQQAVTEHAPPLVHGRRVKLRYAHQGGRCPPIIVIHGNQTERVPKAYQRFLENRFRERFNLRGTPINISLRGGDNPYAGKRNQLTSRQRAKRDRLRRHVKKRK